MSEFEFNQDELTELSNKVLDKARNFGASDAAVCINESMDKSVQILNNGIENFESSYSSNLSLTVYKNNNKASVSISKISSNNIDDVISKALDLVNYTQADEYSKLAEQQYLCQSIDIDLQLFNPCDLTNEKIIDIAKDLESLSLSNKSIKSSDGSIFSYSYHNFRLATTNNFNLGYNSSLFTKSIGLIGETTSGLQTDFYHDYSRNINDLMSNHLLADKAIAATTRRLIKGKIKANNYNVIFESRIAGSLFKMLFSAIVGTNLYRKLTFLKDSLEMQIFPSWVNVYEDPFIIKGLGSCYFDSEGVKVAPKYIIKSGVVKSYLLNCYTARKLNMLPTGNAGGVYNVRVDSNCSGGIAELVKKIPCGLIIIETIGDGLNLNSGDYSVGASGLWFENGEIQYYVDNLTIAGNLRDIYKNIIYISDDHELNRSTHCGSVVVSGISVVI